MTIQHESLPWVDDITATNNEITAQGYGRIRTEIVELLHAARTTSVRSVNALMTATYWEIGRRIIEFEQGGVRRAEYGEELIKQLAGDLTRQFGRGFLP